MLNGASAFKLQHECRSGLHFIAVFGVTSNYCVSLNDHPRTGPDEDLGSLVRSYRDGFLTRDNGRDRIAVPLRDDSVLRVALKKVLVSGKAMYMVVITRT